MEYQLLLDTRRRRGRTLQTGQTWASPVLTTESITHLEVADYPLYIAILVAVLTQGGFTRSMLV